jgi:hypothetical protein
LLSDKRAIYLHEKNVNSYELIVDPMVARKN